MSDLDKMKVAELRTKAKAMGLETGGTKAQLIARIQGDDAPAAAAPKKGKAAPKKAAPKKKKKEEEPEEEEPEEEEQAPKASKAAKGGASATAHESRRIAVDRGVPLANASVYPGHGVMLNQTNIANNNNKFYVIQLLDQGSGKYAVWTRWGRVGEPGQNSCKQGMGLAAAQSEFAKKFREKTKNVWSATIRDTFKAQPGKYTLLDMKEDDDEEEGAPKKVAVKHVNKDSKLPQDLQVFVRKIYAQATGNLKRAIDCEFTSKGIKTPLGVLSLAQVGRGDDVLERIQAVLDGTSSDSLEQLSSEYYTLIPHAHGRVKPKLVNNKLMLQEKKDLSQLMKGHAAGVQQGRRERAAGGRRGRQVRRDERGAALGGQEEPRVCQSAAPHCQALAARGPQEHGSQGRQL